MAISSALFVGIVVGGIAVSYLFPRRFRWVWLLLASLAGFAYAANGTAIATPAFLLSMGAGSSLPGWLPAVVLLAILALASWGFALGIQKASGQKARVLLLCAALVVCLGFWAACKHFSLLPQLLQPTSGGISTGGRTAPTIAPMPFALGYLTLSAVFYLADVFCRHAPAQGNFLKHLFFLSFFPFLFVGPTQRTTAFAPQISNPTPFNYSTVAGGLFRILWGIVKKCVIADGLAIYTGVLFENPTLYTGPMLVLALVLFGYQLYANFSACCDIAIGAATMAGFTSGENFARPFAAKTFAALAQRWHISFVHPLCENVYTPLLASPPAQKLAKKSKALARLASCLAALFTGLLFGLWHGSGWFAAWGACAAALLLLSHYSLSLRNKIAARVPLYKIPAVRGVFQRLFVYLLFCATLVFFVFGLFAPPAADWLRRLTLGWNGLSLQPFLTSVAATGFNRYQGLFCTGAILFYELVEHFAAKKEGGVAAWCRRQKWFVRWPLYYLLLGALLLLGVVPAAMGIYQGF